MKLPISKHQLALLTKRNAAADSAEATARTAQLVAQAAVETARQSKEAFVDIVSCISAEAGNAPAEYASFRFGTDDDGTCFMELVEKPTA